MWPKPDDPTVCRRMQAAHAYARRIFRADLVAGGTEAWGWQGRSLGMPVTTSEGLAWLRIGSGPTDQIIETFWNGAVDAEWQLPSAIPRPRLLRWHEWSDRGWAHRGELYEHADSDPVAPHATISVAPKLPATWWSAVRTSLGGITTVKTTRLTVEPGFLAWAMPHYLGASFGDYSGLPWTTAHGDFHFANLCAPRLHVLDWEGWGLAPPGYDAAMLHSYSLLVPETAAQIHQELSHLLNGPHGRFAERVVITELLHGVTQGANQILTEPLRLRVASILEDEQRH